MIKYAILSVLFILAIIPLSKAAPVLENVSTTSNLWLGESASISLNCVDSNSSISQVYANIIGPSIILPNLDFIQTSNAYNLTVISTYLDRIGQYTVTISCKNNNNQNSSTTSNFTVSKLTGYVNTISPSPAFIGDVIEIGFILKKDSTALSSDTAFNITLNGQNKQLKLTPAYDTNKGWILKFDADQKGTHAINVFAKYDRANVTNSTTVEIKGPIEFNIVSVDKSIIKPNENITLVIKALEKGNVIQVKNENLNIKINDTNINIQNISQSGDSFILKITAPSLSPGNYELKVGFNYGNFSTSLSSIISYPIEVKGRFFDLEDKGIPTQIKFIKGGSETVVSADNSGYYSSQIGPGIYDIQILFPSSTLYLYTATVINFDNPIRYLRLTDANIIGIKTSDVYVYEVVIPFTSALIEMKYDENRIFDESNVMIFRCPTWNFAAKTCNQNFTKINANIDSVRNLAKVNTTSFSAYAIGNERSIRVDFSTDKDSYFLNEIIKVKGITQDEDNNPIPNADIKIQINNTTISASLKSDSSGIFSTEFISPDKEGEYKLSLTADKEPYKKFNKTLSIKVQRIEKLSLIMADLVKIEQGKNASLEIVIFNSGQTELHNVQFQLTGIPSEFYQMPENIDKLSANEEKKVLITFQIPNNQSLITYNGNLKVTSGNITTEQSFSLTILPLAKEETKTQPPFFFFPTGQFILPISSFDLVYTVVLAITSFSVVFWLKRRKSKHIESPEIKSILVEIKSELDKTKQEKVPVKMAERHVTKTDDVAEDKNPEKNIVTALNAFDKLSKRR